VVIVFAERPLVAAGRSAGLLVGRVACARGRVFALQTATENLRLNL
jgi:hypothetical protein